MSALPPKGGHCWPDVQRNLTTFTNSQARLGERSGGATLFFATTPRTKRVNDATNYRTSMVNGMVKMRRIILTKAVLATIPEMVELRGMRTQEIAEELGCKVSTLKVRCSQDRISLRSAGSRHGRSNSGERAIKLNRAALMLLQDRAAASGKTEAALARELIETIARDNLYDAVLDVD